MGDSIAGIFIIVASALLLVAYNVYTLKNKSEGSIQAFINLLMFASALFALLISLPQHRQFQPFPTLLFACILFFWLQLTTERSSFQPKQVRVNHSNNQQ